MMTNELDGKEGLRGSREAIMAVPTGGTLRERQAWVNGFDEARGSDQVNDDANDPSERR